MVLRRAWLPLVLAVFLGVPLGAAAVAQVDQGDYEKGVALLQQQHYEEALPFFQRALAEAERTYGHDDPRVGVDVGNLGEVYRRLGRDDEAEPLLRRSVDLAKKQSDRDPTGLAASLNNLALLYRSQGRLVEAEPLYVQSLALLQKAVGASSPEAAKGLNNLAMLYMQEGKPDQAIPLLERGSAVAQDTLGKDNPTTLAIMANLSEAQSDLAARGGSTASDTPPPPPVIRPQPGKSALPPPEIMAATKAAAASVASPAVGQVAGRKSVEPAAQQSAPVRAARGAPELSRAGAPAAGKAAGYAIHLGSMSSLEAAHTAWGRLVKKYPSLASMQPLPPPSIEVPGKGVFYRVLAGRFATREAAEEGLPSHSRRRRRVLRHCPHGQLMTGTPGRRAHSSVSESTASGSNAGWLRTVSRDQARP